jgi:hypothetical protein
MVATKHIINTASQSESVSFNFFSGNDKLIFNFGGKYLAVLLQCKGW